MARFVFASRAAIAIEMPGGPAERRRCAAGRARGRGPWAVACSQGRWLCLRVRNSMAPGPGWAVGPARGVRFPIRGVSLAARDGARPAWAGAMRKQVDAVARMSAGWAWRVFVPALVATLAACAGAALYVYRSLMFFHHLSHVAQSQAVTLDVVLVAPATAICRTEWLRGWPSGPRRRESRAAARI